MAGAQPEPGGPAATEPAVSVVVATRDRPARLRALLDSLARQTLPTERLEVIVVDDGSAEPVSMGSDGEATPRCEVIRRPRSAGPATARNDGWRRARAPLIAFTDDDCEAAPEWLEAGLEAAGDSPRRLVQGRTEPNPAERDASGPFSRTLRVTELGPHFQTCNVFYPRALLERLGGFDERFPYPAGEDTDLAWRAIESGAEAVFAPRALVHHAVEDHGPVGRLRIAARWWPHMYVLKRHPGYRAKTRWRRIFWKQSHFLLATAIVGGVAARRFPPAALLAVPYARHLLGRARDAGASPATVPYLALHDLVEMAAAIRGGIRYRLLVL